MRRGEVWTAAGGKDYAGKLLSDWPDRAVRAPSMLSPQRLTDYS